MLPRPVSLSVAAAGLSKEEREVGGLDGEGWWGPEGGRWAALCVCVSTLGVGVCWVCAGVRVGRGVEWLVLASRGVSSYFTLSYGFS